MSEFDDLVAALVAPEDKAYWAWVDGKDESDNPYSEGSEDHKAYNAEMKRCGESLE